MLSCSSNSKRDKNLSFYKVPTVITHQGKETQNISEARRQQWLNNIKREDVKNGGYKYPYVCSFHFHTGKTLQIDLMHNDVTRIYARDVFWS